MIYNVLKLQNGFAVYLSSMPGNRYIEKDVTLEEGFSTFQQLLDIDARVQDLRQFQNHY